MKVFLGGTCNESTWRNRIIPRLEIDYFNPVVDDWTPDCMEQEIKERENSDFCLFAITPRMTGAYSIAEVVDDSNKRPEKTILVLLRYDKDLYFNKSQWKSLGAVARMVKSNGGQVFDNLKEAAIYMNKLAVLYRINREIEAKEASQTKDTTNTRNHKCPVCKGFMAATGFRMMCTKCGYR